jgi:hypothetical protein
LNDVTLVDRLRYNLRSVSQLVDADLSVLFHKLILEFLIHLVVLFVVFLGLEMSFKLISYLLSLPSGICSLNLLLSSRSGIGG